MSKFRDILKIYFLATKALKHPDTVILPYGAGEDTKNDFATKSPRHPDTVMLPYGAGKSYKKKSIK
ncbi:MAG: hypothetical protein ISS16_09435 [Ignavibacteria bacterium]|nr:hypothetical protein [Ignavibacteria bacterium]